MNKPTASFPDAVWDGSSRTRTDPGHVAHPPDSEDWDQIVAEMAAVETELTSSQILLTEVNNLRVVSEANVVGGLPVVHQITVPDSAGNIDIVLTNKTRITDVVVIKNGHAGGVGDTITVKNGTTAITDIMDIGVADKIIVRALSIDDASFEIAAGGTLRVTAAKATHCDCIVYIHGVRS